MTASQDVPTLQFELDGRQVEVPDDGASLLGTLRDRLGSRSPKDGCSPQGQCGCCTVLVDGQPRVACVTPTRRIKGRSVTTLDGLDEADQQRWANAFCATGASQCGFCTPGIVVRLAGLEAKKPDATHDDVNKALAAHLCRCTGWQTIHEAWDLRNETEVAITSGVSAGERATLEGGVAQDVGPAIVLGRGGFADDTAPEDALVAVRAASGDWVVGDTVHEARERAGKIQGRRTTLVPRYPLALPTGEWAATLQTTWTEPGYLETDASWAMPDGEAASPLANAGAFGAKADSLVREIAQSLAAEHGRPVRVLFSREDTVHLGPKRPPVAGGMQPDGSGVLRVVATPGIDERIGAVAPGLVVEHVEVPDQLATSAAIRGAGWVEALCLHAMATGTTNRVVLPDSPAWAEAEVDDESIRVRVHAGAIGDPVVLRSYCIGAAHMATSLVRSEALTVDDAGVVQDLTIRSFGILRAVDMPRVEVELIDSNDESVNGSDLVFGAVAAATSLYLGASLWPHR